MDLKKVPRKWAGFNWLRTEWNGRLLWSSFPCSLGDFLTRCVIVSMELVLGQGCTKEIGNHNAFNIQ
jgi:hypothetical protein